MSNQNENQNNTSGQSQERYQELTNRCTKCVEEYRKMGLDLDRRYCSRCCEVGQELHKYDSKEWDTVDWNSSQYEGFYCK